MYLKTKEKIYTGIKDVKGNKLFNGDYVKHPFIYNGADLSIYGKIVYDCQSIHEGEYCVKHYTTGFLIKYSDNSGYTGLNYDWIKVAPEEYYKHKNNNR